MFHSQDKSMKPLLMSAAALLALGGTGAQAATALDAHGAQALVDAFYGALTSTSPADLPARLGAVVAPDWRNCGGDACQDLDATVRRWSGRMAVVPDLRWRQVAVVVAGDTLVVRGEASGTPVAPFLGLAPGGRSFHVMTIDMHVVRDGRIVQTHHLEDWATALRQLAPAAP
jgi:predicted ester cyclase